MEREEWRGEEGGKQRDIKKKGKREESHLLSTLHRFRDGKEKLLITTNLCARGICMEGVTLVVNYDIPTNTQSRVDCETYQHR